MKRLFQLAKELGVESKAIMDKCTAEGLDDIKNHMATISAGLEATIREWFTEAAGSVGGSTAVETAAKVDLNKAKAKPRRRKKLGEEGGDDHADEHHDETTDTALMDVEHEEADAPAVAHPAEPVHVAPSVIAPTAPPVVEPSAPAIAATASPAAPHAPVSHDEVGHAEKRKRLTPVPPVVPDTHRPAAHTHAPAPLKPAASVALPPAQRELVQPTAAKLKGPRVVRIEEPEVMQRPKPRMAPERSGSPANSNLIPTRGPARGKGIVESPGGGPGGPPGEKDDEVGRSPRRKKVTGGKKNSAEAEVWFKGVRREQDLLEREERLSHAVGFLRQRRRQQAKKDHGGGAQALQPSEAALHVEISEPITIKNLSAAAGIKSADIIKFLFAKGVMATINNTIAAELAMEVCLEQDIDLIVKEAQTAEQEVEKGIEDRQRTDVRRRPPIVAVLGHVDHGKTSLLDKIRSTDVAAGESGGITQHIGAFRASITGTDGKPKTVVFLDTPGHQAFSNMRARGATLADVVVLVIAAEDGVMPQTIESIAHAKAANVPIVIALNKVDKPEVNEATFTRVYGQLAANGLNPVPWGGDTEVMKVSALTGQGVTELMEVLDYQAEIQELTADYGGPAYGQVIEAELDPGRGPIARVLIREGNMHLGDFVVIGRAFGKVRSMTDDRGVQLKEAGPATPVEIAGIGMVPDAGDKVYVTDSLAKAEEIAEQRHHAERQLELASKGKVSLENVFDQMQATASKELRVVLKVDVQGSMEVLRKALEDLSTPEVKVKVLHAAVGGITESDVVLADASAAVIVGFHVIASHVARAEAERRKVDVRLYRIIYDIVDDVKRALEGMLAPQRREEVLGHAEVREVFKVSKVGTIAGGIVTDGVVRRNALIRVTRNGIVVEHDRQLETLKRFKEDAKEVRSGMECGMKIDKYDDIHVGDVLECYLTTQVKPTLA
jgi:translation initiation factor IF-2